MRLFAFILLVVPFTLVGQHDLFHQGEIAFDGNDIVSYYEEASPLKGKPQFEHKHAEGVVLQFANQSNLEKFVANPEKYMPAYDGWCALAIAQNSYIRPDFNTYKVQEGKLLFFEVRAFFNGKTFWEKDPDINKIVADKKYNALKEN